MPQTPRFRDHALLFDPHITSDHKEVELAVDRIFDQVVAKRKEANKRINDLAAVRLHVKVIILNVYVSDCSFPYVYRAVSRRAPDYSRPESRYLKVRLSREHIANAIDDLSDLGFIEKTKGMYFPEIGKQFVTRIRAENRLIESLTECGVELSMVTVVPTESIRLRDENGHAVDYKDTVETIRMRANLQLINDSIAKSNIQLALTGEEMDHFRKSLAEDNDRPPFDLNSHTLHRVFNNNSWEQGGRFYGAWWQNIPRDIRPFILIDGKATVEDDYSGLHIRMIYAQAKLECPDDPYDLPDFPRDDQKRAMQMIINADSDEKAIGAMKGKGIENSRKLCDALCERHSPIKDSFFTGLGIRLQFADSQFSESIMLGLVKQGGIALPVHDSFIVEQDRAGQLTALMTEVFQKAYPNVQSKQKRKKTLYDLAYKGPATYTEHK